MPGSLLGSFLSLRKVTATRSGPASSRTPRSGPDPTSRRDTTPRPAHGTTRESPPLRQGHSRSSSRKVLNSASTNGSPIRRLWHLSSRSGPERAGKRIPRSKSGAVQRPAVRDDGPPSNAFPIPHAKVPTRRMAGRPGGVTPSRRRLFNGVAFQSLIRGSLSTLEIKNA
jgi:hypothetical protein